MRYTNKSLSQVLVVWATLILATTPLVSAQTPDATWNLTGSLHHGLYAHSGTLLHDGKVLVAGGFGSAGLTNTAELYDPNTGTWRVTGNLTEPRYRFTATLLKTGKVLVAGGYTAFSPTPGDTAELYDPATGTWSQTGRMNNRRAWHTATLLPNGKVLVVGGLNDGTDTLASLLNTAEVYDPDTQIWSITGSLNSIKGRVAHTATLLQNGKVLVVGGTDAVFFSFTFGEEYGPGLESAESYDPATGRWTTSGSLNTGRMVHTATLLQNGNVLVVGGGSSPVGLLIDMPDTTELYTPTTGTWSYTGDLSHRVYHTATLLPSGQVLVTGGEILQDTRDEADLFNPATGSWTRIANHSVPRFGHTATLLSNGNVLVVGGFSGCCILLDSAELFDSVNSPTGNAIDDAQFFVRQQYLDFLNREPDMEGLAFWTNEITSCGTDQECIAVKRINVSAAFFLSIEFQETGFLAYRSYKAAYGNLPNAPVPITFSETMSDASVLSDGVIVNQPGWQDRLERNKQVFFAEFTQRSRFTSLFPPSMSAAEFVDSLNRNAGNPLSAEQRDQLVMSLSTGALSRAQVLRIISHNGQFAAAEFNRAFVLMQYFGYLRRNPDLSGFNFWLNKLEQFNGNFVDAEMVKAFLVSGEYRHRFGP